VFVNTELTIMKLQQEPGEPHFIIVSDAPEAHTLALQRLEALIHTDPTRMLALCEGSPLDVTGDKDSDRERLSLIEFAISSEAVGSYAYDEQSEAAIVHHPRLVAARTPRAGIAGRIAADRGETPSGQDLRRIWLSVFIGERIIKEPHELPETG
jgi:hypothetical protein